MSGKNWLFKSGKTIRLLCDFCRSRIWKKCRIPIWVFDYFLCSSYRYGILNFWISYLFRPTRLSYYSSKLPVSNVWEKLTFQIRQNYPAPVGFLPEPDFEKVLDSGQSRSRNPVQP